MKEQKLPSLPKVIIQLRDDMSTSLEVEGAASYDGLVALLFTALEGITKTILNDAEKEGVSRDEMALDLYESLDAIFDSLRERVFPGIQPKPFDLTDAAVLYAQDKIIEMIEKKGITYEEAMRKFEARAKEYYRQKKAGYLS